MQQQKPQKNLQESPIQRLTLLKEIIQSVVLNAIERSSRKATESMVQKSDLFVYK